MTSDHHHATVSTQKKNIRIRTWNIQTLLQPQKVENVKLEMKQLNVNILDLGEMRWKTVRISTSDKPKFIHPGRQKYEKEWECYWIKIFQDVSFVSGQFLTESS